MLQVIVTLGLLGVGLMAIISRRALSPLVPDVPDLAESLWTALLAGIVGAYIVKVSRVGAKDPDQLLARSRRTIPDDLWSYAESTSVNHQADPKLTHALMLVENLGRPPWFRRLEAAKGLVLPAGTYGVMQVESTKPISDKESIDSAVMRLSGVRPFVDGQGYLDVEGLREFAKSYNDDGDYADLVVEAYSRLHYGVQHP